MGGVDTSGWEEPKTKWVISSQCILLSYLLLDKVRGRRNIEWEGFTGGREANGREPDHHDGQ